MTSQYDREFQLFEDTKSKYNALHREFNEDDTLVHQRFGQHFIPDEWQDEGLEPVTLPTAYDAVENATDHILTFPKISVPIRPVERGTVQAEQRAADTQRFLDFFWQRVFEECDDPLGHVKKSVVKGMGVLKKTIRWECLPFLPENPTAAQKRTFRRRMERVSRSEFLWDLKVLPKETVFPDPVDPCNPRYVFEAFDITISEARERFGNLQALEQRSDELGTVRYVEYWSRPYKGEQGKYIQWIEGDRVHEGENPYSWETAYSSGDKPTYAGYVPYCIIEPGWGDTDKDNRPENRFISIVRPIRSTTVAESRQLTAVESWLRRYVWPVVKGKNLQDVEDGEKTLDMGPGAIWNFSEDQDAEVLAFGEAPITVFQFLTKVQSTNDRSSKFGSLGGQPQRGVDTASEADANMRNAATRLSGPVNAIRRAIIRINAWVLQDIEKVLEAPVTLFGATNHDSAESTLGPKDINGFYVTNVELSTSDEAALNLRNARTWADLSEVMPLRKMTAMRMAGIQNPMDEFDGRIIEDLERSEPAMNLMLMMMLDAFANTPAGTTVQQAFQQSLMQQQGQQGQGQQAGSQSRQPALPDDPGQATMTQARDEAIQAQPERQMY